MSRIAILILASAMTLRQMGLANDIINMAFELGGREIAAKQVGRWLEKVLPEKTDE